MGSKGQEKERLAHRMRGSGEVKKDKGVRKTTSSFKQKRLCGLMLTINQDPVSPMAEEIQYLVLDAQFIWKSYLFFKGKRYFLKFLRCY